MMDYKADPVLFQTFETKQKKSIFGLTILNEELFILSESSSEVEVYKSKSLEFSRSFKVNDLVFGWDVASCKRNQCLYIVDCKYARQSHEILRIDPSNGTLIKNWSLLYDEARSLSVTDEGNVVVPVPLNQREIIETSIVYCSGPGPDRWENKLTEYSPDGQLIHEMKLTSSDGKRIYPNKAVKLTSGQFVVSHLDDPHNVSIVDDKGVVIKSFNASAAAAASAMKYPEYLAVDSMGNILVIDKEKGGRVLLLDSNLEWRMDLIVKGKDGIEGPWRMHLDESNGRLIVNGYGSRVHSFSVITIS